MKKIIIATIMVIGAAGWTFGSACAPQPKEDTAWVYKWQFKGKTTTGKKVGVAASACSAGPTCTIRVPASLKIQGYTWCCAAPSCDGENLGFETAFAEANEVFWATKPYKASFYGGVTTEIAHLIGKKKKQVEIGGNATFTDENSTNYSLTYAGLGKYKLGKGYVKSASGSFAGFVDAPKYVKTKTCTMLDAGIWSCDTLSLICDYKPSVCYGKWSVKFKKSASQKFHKNGNLPKYPSWVAMLNQ